MTFQDQYGCETTIKNNTALENWNQVLNGFLSHSAQTAIALGKTLELDPEFTLGQACKGLFSLLLCRSELDETINSALQKAKQCDQQNPVSERERHFIVALEAWTNGKQTQSIQSMEAVLKRWPHDALAMKLSHAIRFMLGDLKGMRNSLENLMPVYQNHKAEGYFLGCHAFALEETGDYKLAEKQGYKALELASDDAWGLHAVSHVFDMTGRAKEGLEWMSGKESVWQHCNNFRYHVWWHKALMHLDLGDHETVLALYDEQIRQDKTDDYRDISNATSALLRLEFDGVNVGNRWEELSQLASGRTQDNLLAFADLHYMMALCGTNNHEDATRLLANMKARKTAPNAGDFEKPVGHPGAIAAAGLEAWRDQDFTTSFHCLNQARPALQEIGGSHAQRDIFERLAIESAIRAGLYEEAGQVLTERDNLRSVKDHYSSARWEIVNQGLVNSSVATQDVA